MHLSDPRVLSLGEAAEAAFTEAQALAVETLEIREPAAMAGALLARPELTQLPAGTELSDLVPEAARRAELEAALRAAGTPPEAVRTLQPWFVAAALVLPPCEAERQATGAVVLDLDLLDRAEAAGKELAGLETAVEQMEALASMPLDAQTDNLLATLDLQDRLADIFETMTLLYGEGEIAAITPVIEHIAPDDAETAESAAVYAAFEERVVTERNHRMAERLQPLIEAGGVFAAVGALHLPGQEGLVELLRSQGWQVSRAD